MAAGRKGKKRKNRLGVLAIGTVALILMAVLGVQTYEMKQKDRAYEERQKQLEGQIAEEEKRGEELSEQEIYITTKQYIEQMAREKFGLVMPDDIILKGED